MSSRILETRDDGLEIIELENDKMKVVVSNFGGVILSLKVKDRNGLWQDVVLGYESLNDYKHYDKYVGALVGRVANRIRNGEFELNGKTYHTPVNNGPNSNHGGEKGFSFRPFKTLLKDDRVLFSRVSPDGEEGYPGTLHFMAEYVLRDDILILHYTAQSDEDTLLNITHHSYFNLSGYPCAIDDHILSVRADEYGKVDENGLYTGEIASVEGTPFDFRKARTIKTALDAEDTDEQIKLGAGLDHHFFFTADKNQVVLYSPHTGIEMTVSTSMPGAQIYTANYLDGEKGKNGFPLERRDAVCIETQCTPDDIHVNKENPETLLKKGETYDEWTSYRFKTRL